MFSLSTAGQALRFLAVGGANTIVSLAIIFVLRFAFGASDLMANFCGYAVGFVMSFALNRSFTFADNGPVAPAVLRFMICAGFAYAVNLAVLMAVIAQIGAGSVVSQLAAAASYSCTFFVLAKLYAFSSASRVPSGSRG